VSTQSTGSDNIGSVNGGDGNFSQNTVGDDIENPWAVATQITNQTKTDNSRTNVYADLQLIEGLNFKTTVGYRTQNGTEGYFKPQTFVLSAGGGFIESVKRTSFLNENPSVTVT